MILNISYEGDFGISEATLVFLIKFNFTEFNSKCNCEHQIFKLRLPTINLSKQEKTKIIVVKFWVYIHQDGKVTVKTYKCLLVLFINRFSVCACACVCVSVQKSMELYS